MRMRKTSLHLLNRPGAWCQMTPERRVGGREESQGRPLVTPRGRGLTRYLPLLAITGVPDTLSTERPSSCDERVMTRGRITQQQRACVIISAIIRREEDQ